MQQIYNTLKSTGRLKYKGRLQLGLFLKGIGIPIEEALSLWRKLFTHNESKDKFYKEHSYNLRHNYGQEGSRKNYRPYNCIRIIMDLPGPLECHGCPFRALDAQDIQTTL